MGLDDDVPTMSVFLQFTSRLATLWCWLAIALAHLAALTVVLAVLWASQATPASVLTQAQSLAQSTPVAWGAGIGLSLLGVLYAYWRLVRRASQWLHLQFVWPYLVGKPKALAVMRWLHRG